MDALLESKDMVGKSAEEQAKQAIRHVLNRIRNEYNVADIIGYGTQTFDLLTEAAATLHNEPVERVRKYYAGMEDWNK